MPGSLGAPSASADLQALNQLVSSFNQMKAYIVFNPLDLVFSNWLVPRPFVCFLSAYAFFALRPPSKIAAPFSVNGYNATFV